MYNIRGSDVPCNPVSVAYAVVTRASPGASAGAWLFIDEAKLPTETVKHLTQARLVYFILFLPLSCSDPSYTFYGHEHHLCTVIYNYVTFV